VTEHQYWLLREKRNLTNWVIGKCHTRYRAVEFREFLDEIEAAVRRPISACWIYICRHSLKSKGPHSIPPRIPTCALLLWDEDVLAALRYRISAKASTCTRKSGLTNCGCSVVPLAAIDPSSL
jgi:hypothetical protein